MRKKSGTPLEDLAAAEQAQLEMRGEAVEMTGGEEEENRPEEVEGSAAVDSQEEETFLKKAQPNGEPSSNPETSL